MDPTMLSTESADAILAQARADAGPADLRLSLSMLTAASSEMAAALEKRNLEYKTLLLRMGDLSNQVETLTTELHAADSERAAAREELALCHGQTAALEAEMTDLQTANERRATENAALQTQIEDIQTLLAGAQAARAAVDEELTLAQASHTALETRLNDQTADLQTQLEAALTAKTEAEAKRVATESDLAALDAARGQLDQTQARLSALQSEYDAALASKGELAAALQARETELAGLHGDVEVLTAQATAAAPVIEAAALDATLDDLPGHKRGAATAAVIAGVQPSFAGKLQALSLIKGIGSVFQQRLYQAGIGVFWEVANLQDDDMRSALHLGERGANRFDFGAIRADAYRLAQETGTVGLIWQGARVDDFETLPGLGKVFEQRLYEAGVCTYEGLIGAGQERLAEIVQAPEMSRPDFGAWLELAHKRIEERQAEPTEPAA